MAEENNIKSRIESISKENPFKTPDHYFDNFSIHMADKIVKVKNSKVKEASPTWLRPQLAIVALSSFLLIISLGIYFIGHKEHKILSVQELSNNLEYNIVSEMDETELLGQLEKIEKKQSLPVDSLKKSQQEYSKQVIEYLSKEDIDINSIVDAL